MIQLLQKYNPTAFSPMGGGLVPTQVKKKKKKDFRIKARKLANIREAPKHHSPQTPAKMKALANTSKK